MWSPSFVVARYIRNLRYFSSARSARFIPKKLLKMNRRRLSAFTYYYSKNANQRPNEFDCRYRSKNVSTVVFWHNDDFIGALRQLVFSNFQDQRYAVILRKVRDENFEAMICNLGRLARRKVYFVNDRKDYVNLLRTESEMGVWIFGAEFLLSNQEYRQVFERTLKRNGGTIMAHTPWQKNVWSEIEQEDFSISDQFRRMKSVWHNQHIPIQEIFPSSERLISDV